MIQPTATFALLAALATGEASTEETRSGEMAVGVPEEPPESAPVKGR